MKKLRISLLIVLILIALPLNNITVAKSTSKVLTLDQAVNLAINNSNELETLGKKIKDLRKQYAGSYAKDIPNSEQYVIPDRLNELYSKMISGRLMSLDEQGELVLLYTILDNTEYTKNKSLTPYLSTIDFPNASDCSAIVKTSINRELTYISIKNQTIQLYNSILYLIDSVNNIADLYQLKKSQSREAEIRLKHGQISDEARMLAEIDCEKQKLALDKERRNLQNLEMKFKVFLGVNLNEEIVFTDYKIDEKAQINDYNEYVNEALIFRNEIISPKMDLKVKGIELYNFNLVYRSDQRTDELDIYKRDLELQINELKNEIKQNESNVVQNTKNAYVNLNTEVQLLQNSKIEMLNAKKNYIAAETKQKTSTISEIDLLQYQVLYNQAKSNYNKELRDFYYDLNIMKNCCSIGPEFK